jgi:predicted nucleic acid-binding Zn ribbon protein
MANRYQCGNQKTYIEVGQVLSVLLQCMPSDYLIGICWPLYRLSYFNVCLLITPLLYVGHCIVCPTSMYAFWLPHWYLLAIVSSVLLQCMSSDYHIGICWPLYRLSYFNVCLLITTLVSFGHCIVCSTSMYAFWLPHRYLLAIVLSVLLQCMPSDYHIGICWPLYRLSYFNVCLLITTLISVGHCIVCPTSMYAFWLPLCYLLAIVSSVLLQCMSSDYHFVICWPLYCLSYFNVCLLITPLSSVPNI